MFRSQTELSPQASNAAAERFAGMNGASQDFAVCLDDPCVEVGKRIPPRTRGARFLDALLRALSAWTV